MDFLAYNRRGSPCGGLRWDSPTELMCLRAPTLKPGSNRETTPQFEFAMKKAFPRQLRRKKLLPPQSIFLSKNKSIFLSFFHCTPWKYLMLGCFLCFQGMLKKAASSVLALLPCSRTMSTLRASKGLRPCWTDFFEHSLPLTMWGSSGACIGY